VRLKRRVEAFPGRSATSPPPRDSAAWALCPSLISSVPKCPRFTFVDTIIVFTGIIILAHRLSIHGTTKPDAYTRKFNYTTRPSGKTISSRGGATLTVGKPKSTGWDSNRPGLATCPARAAMFESDQSPKVRMSWPAATVTNCLPTHKKVIGAAVTRPPVTTCHISWPVLASSAKKFSS